MRLIKHSVIKDPEGIRVTCACGAEYIIESRDDWDGEYVQAYSESNREMIEVYRYESKCPECGWNNYHGFDYRIVSGIPQFMFERDDWEERFQIPDDWRKAYR